MAVKYILSSKKSYSFSGIYINLFLRSVSFFEASMCFVLFEVTFMFKFFSLSSKFVFSRKSEISGLATNFASLNLAAKLSGVKLLNFCVVIYLS